MTTLYPISSMFNDVADFHTLVLQEEQPVLPTLVSQEYCLERFKFLNEEADEFYGAAMQGDMVKAVDGLLDTVYVALGTLWKMGLSNSSFTMAWNAVQNANMRKIRGIGPRGNQVDAVKPKDWNGPEAEIAAAIWKTIDPPDDA